MLGLFAMGGAVDIIGGIVLGVVIAVLTVFSIITYLENISLMDAYLSGDASAGDRLIQNAIINSVLTLGFWGGGAATKAIVKKAVKNHLAKEIGQELAEKLLKECSDPGKLLRATEKLKQAGMPTEALAELAGKLEAESLEQLGKLAGKGLPLDLIEALGRNEASLKNVTDLSELLLFKNTNCSPDTIATLLAEKGDDFIRVYRQYEDELYGMVEAYGDDFVPYVVTYGEDVMKGIRTHQETYITLLREHKDIFVRMYRTYDEEAITAFTQYDAIIKNFPEQYKEQAVDLVIRYGDDVISGLQNHYDDFMKRYVDEGEEFVAEYLEKGDGVFGSGSGTVTIVKEINLFIDYLNNAGTTVRIAKQSQKSIANAIESRLNSTNAGDVVEAKVANYIKNELGIELTSFSSIVKTPHVLIEVKKSIASVDVDQFEKYVNNNAVGHINVTNKKVVLYVDEEMTNLNALNQGKIDEVKKMGVEVVNCLEELIEVLE